MEIIKINPNEEKRVRKFFEFADFALNYNKEHQLFEKGNPRYMIFGYLKNQPSLWAEPMLYFLFGCIFEISERTTLRVLQHKINLLKHSIIIEQPEVIETPPPPPPVEEDAPF